MELAPSERCGIFTIVISVPLSAGSADTVALSFWANESIASPCCRESVDGPTLVPGSVTVSRSPINVRLVDVADMRLTHSVHNTSNADTYIVETFMDIG